MEIQQTPFALSLKGDASVTLHCGQDDDQFYYMYWYRQKDNKKLQLLAYSLGKNAASIVPPFTESKYTLSRPLVLKSSLMIHDLDNKDLALYYCTSTN